jgi:hypothetical protein
VRFAFDKIQAGQPASVLMIRADRIGDQILFLPFLASLRKQMASKRGKKKIFDRGFESIEELKSRCKAETGFDPPAAPRFTKWAAVAAEAMKRAEAAAKKGSKAA